MTTAPIAVGAAISRLDDGVGLPGDHDLADIFDAHCADAWWPFVRLEETRAFAALLDSLCPVCRLERSENGQECTTCYVLHDVAVARSADV